MRIHLISEGVVQNTVLVGNSVDLSTMFPDFVAVPADQGPPEAAAGWIYDGVSFSPPPPPPPPVPDRVTARQARLALNAVGLLDDVEAAILASPREVQLTWEYATEIERNNPILAQVAAGFGLTNEQMDDLFRQAATL